MSKSNDLGRYGTAAKADKATSGTPTSGLVDAALGFYGVGVNQPEIIADADLPAEGDQATLQKSRLVTVNASTANLPSNFGTQTAAPMLILSGNTRRMAELLFADNSNRAAFRTRSFTEAFDRDWNELYHTGNNIDARDYGIGASPSALTTGGYDQLITDGKNRLVPVFDNAELAGTRFVLSMFDNLNNGFQFAPQGTGANVNFRGGTGRSSAGVARTLPHGQCRRHRTS